MLRTVTCRALLDPSRPGTRDLPPVTGDRDQRTGAVLRPRPRRAPRHAAPRHPRRRGLSALALVLVVVATYVSIGGVTVRGASSADAAAPPPLEVGFSLSEIIGMSGSDTAQLLDAAKGAGATTVRFDVAWSTVEPTQGGAEDWAVIDRAVDALRERELRLLPVIGYTPPWARAPGCDALTCPPASPAAFGRFVHDVVERYDGPDVAAWEVWNEPNASSWTPGPDPAAYARVLRAARSAVDARGSAAPVLSGGLAPAADGPSTMDPARFLREVYAAGGRGDFDAVAMHPYAFPALPGEGQEWSGWTQMHRVRDVMVAHGDAALEVWATELGAPTLGSGAQATLADRRYDESPDHVDRELQAATVTAAFAQAERDEWLRALLWYSFLDLPEGHGDTGTPLHGYGIVDRQPSPKPAYGAWRTGVRGALAGS